MEYNKQTLIDRKRMIEEDALTDIGIDANSSGESKTETLLLLQHGLINFELNMKMYHWGSKGKNFDNLHETFEEYERTASTHLDDVAEMTMMVYKRPIAYFQLPDSELHLDSSKSELLGTIEGCRRHIQYLVKLFDMAINKCPMEEVKTKLEDLRYYWFKELNYKLRRKLLSR